MQDNYACLITPSRAPSAYFGDSNGKSSTTYRRNRTDAKCPPGLPSLAISLGPVTNTGGTLTAIATVTTVEYGMQGVVFAVDGHYVSAVMGAGPYNLKYGAGALSSGSHSVTATVVDAVGVLTVSAKQSVSTSSKVGPSGPIGSECRSRATGLRYRRERERPINGRP